LPALAGQRELRAVIHVGGVATTCGTAALRELAETSEPLDFRLLIHDCSFAIRSSGLVYLSGDVGPGSCFFVRATFVANRMPPLSPRIETA
jgi:hypothetical protein